MRLSAISLTVGAMLISLSAYANTQTMDQLVAKSQTIRM